MQPYQAVTQETISQVRVGAHVVVELIDDQGAHERLEFDLVPDTFADFDNGLLGVQTPLGKVILGKRAGALVSYHMGEVQQVRVIAIGPARFSHPATSEDRRQTLLKEARTAVERTTAEMFAASYSGKWGDYELSDDGRRTMDNNVRR